MQINFIQKHIHLSEEQKNYIQEKLEHLKRFRRVEDESTLIRVDVENFDNKASGQDIALTVNMVLPHHTVRAEVEANTVEEAIDLAHDKLKVQLEKYKEMHS